MESTRISDEEMVAYLDGELDPARRADIEAALAADAALRDRLASLQVDTAAIRSTFDSLLAQAPAPPLRQETASRPSPSSRRMAAMAAGLLMAAALGFTAGRFSAPESAADWRMAVAEYQVLYRSETLSHLEREPAALESERARVVAKLGLDIDGQVLMNLEGLSYRRAQVLGYEAAPLVQFAYLDDQQNPVAFCITSTREADRSVETQTLKGLASASWVSDGYAFVVIGDVEADFIRRTAERLADALPG